MNTSHQPLTAEPNGGWCGGWVLKTPGYPATRLPDYPTTRLGGWLRVACIYLFLPWVYLPLLRPNGSLRFRP